MVDFFDMDLSVDENAEPPKMTKDEFIQKTRTMLQLILDEYSENHTPKFKEGDEDNICSRCNGFLFIESGGVGDVDCPSCNGTGMSNEIVFDAENFLDFIEHEVMFGKQPFLNLLHCEITDINGEQQ